LSVDITSWEPKGNFTHLTQHAFTKMHHIMQTAVFGKRLEQN